MHSSLMKVKYRQGLNHTERILPRKVPLEEPCNSQAVLV